jgi:hypothetical protein
MIRCCCRRQNDNGTTRTTPKCRYPNGVVAIIVAQVLMIAGLLASLGTSGMDRWMVVCVCVMMLLIFELLCIESDPQCVFFIVVMGDCYLVVVENMPQSFFPNERPNLNVVRGLGLYYYEAMDGKCSWDNTNNENYHLYRTSLGRDWGTPRGLAIGASGGAYVALMGLLTLSCYNVRRLGRTVLGVFITCVLPFLQALVFTGMQTKLCRTYGCQFGRAAIYNGIAAGLFFLTGLVVLFGTRDYDRDRDPLWCQSPRNQTVSEATKETPVEEMSILEHEEVCGISSRDSYWSASPPASQQQQQQQQQQQLSPLAEENNNNDSGKRKLFTPSYWSSSPLAGAAAPSPLVQDIGRRTLFTLPDTPSSSPAVEKGHRGGVVTAAATTKRGTNDIESQQQQQQLPSSPPTLSPPAAQRLEQLTKIIESAEDEQDEFETHAIFPQDKDLEFHDDDSDPEELFSPLSMSPVTTTQQMMMSPIQGLRSPATTARLHHHQQSPPPPRHLGTPVYTFHDGDDELDDTQYSFPTDDDTLADQRRRGQPPTASGDIEILLGDSYERSDSEMDTDGESSQMMPSPPLTPPTRRRNQPQKSRRRPERS